MNIFIKTKSIFKTIKRVFETQIVGGKLSVEGGIKLAEMSGDPAKVKNSEVVSKACESVGGGDRYVFH